MPQTPFMAGLGIVFERYDPDEVTVRLLFREDLTNDGTYFHGGVIARSSTAPALPRPGRTTTSTRGHGPRRWPWSIQYVGAAKRSDLLATPAPCGGARS